MGALESTPKEYKYIPCCNGEKATFLSFHSYNHEDPKSFFEIRHSYYDPIVTAHPEIDHACSRCIAEKLEKVSRWARFPRGLMCDIRYTISGQTPAFKILDVKNMLQSFEKEQRLKESEIE